MLSGTHCPGQSWDWLQFLVQSKYGDISVEANHTDSFDSRYDFEGMLVTMYTMYGMLLACKIYKNEHDCTQNTQTMYTDNVHQQCTQITHRQYTRCATWGVECRPRVERSLEVCHPAQEFQSLHLCTAFLDNLCRICKVVHC